MKIRRHITQQILSNLEKRKINIIYWARQVWKTTLAKDIIKEYNKKTLNINADQKKYNDIFSTLDLKKIKWLISWYELLFIDEAQRIENIWLSLKIIHDEFPEIKILVTGSSSFELANKVKEPLTWRTITSHLYPISFLELQIQQSPFELQETIENILRFGLYPEIYTEENIQEKNRILEELSESYLYKDILLLENIKYTEKLNKLLILLSFQIGNEVSLSELARKLSINIDTVQRYIHLLEKSFIIFRLSWFSRNLRKEVSKMDKIYFYDLWIRNMLIKNTEPLENRNDVGQLFENFLILERLKFLKYNRISANQYFRRTYTWAEIDYIEETWGKLSGYEFKFSKNKARIPETFINTYSNSSWKLINKNNFLEFVT